MATKKCAKCAAKPAPAKKAAAAITKADIIAKIADEAKITKVQADAAYGALVALVYKSAKNTITLPGLCKISVGKRAARTGRNPSTGAAIKIPAAKVVKIKALKPLKDAI